MPGERGGALGRARDLRHFRDVAGIALESCAQHLRVAEDHGEEIVEVVRDAAREAAERLHLLRLQELGFLLAQSLLRPLAPAALFGFEQRPAHRRPEARQSLLEDVIGGTATHALDRGLLAELARDADEGNAR